MSVPAFTPGPWHIEDDAKAYAPPCVTVMSGEIIIAEVLADDSEGVDAEVVATAHLIAAAPELYEALELAQWQSEQYRAALGLPEGPADKQAKAALAKARGDA